MDASRIYDLKSLQKSKNPKNSILNQNNKDYAKAATTRFNIKHEMNIYKPAYLKNID